MSEIRPSPGEAVDQLVGLCDGLPLAVHPSTPDHLLRLLLTLGVDVRFDENAPLRCDCV